jgi:hypothetical protein
MLKQIYTFWIILFVLSPAMFLLNCGEESSSDIPVQFTNVTDELAAGWAAYMDGDYYAARDHFITVAEYDADIADAYNGMGWTCMRMRDFASASSQFSFVISLATIQGNDTLKADAYAGLFLRYYVEKVTGVLNGEISETQADELLLQGIQYADSVLQINPQYSSSHDPGFDVAAVKKLMAYSFYSMHRFYDTMEYLDEDILSSVSLDTVTEEVHLESDDNGNVIGSLPSGGAIKILSVTDQSEVVVDGELAYTVATDPTEEAYFDYYLRDDDEMVFANYNDYSYRSRSDTLVAFSLPDYFDGGGIMISPPRAGIFQINSIHLDTMDVELVYWIYKPNIGPIPPKFAWNFVKIIKSFDYVKVGNKFVIDYAFRNYNVTYQRTDDFLELMRLIENYL